MSDNDAVAAAINALSRNTDRIFEEMRETRKSMDRMRDENLDNAVKLERLLTQVESFDQKAQKIEQIDRRQDAMEIRLSLIEVQVKDVPENGKRLKVLEDARLRAMAMGTGVVIVMEIVFQVAKAIWGK